MKTTSILIAKYFLALVLVFQLWAASAWLLNQANDLANVCGSALFLATITGCVWLAVCDIKKLVIKLQNKNEKTR